MEQTKTEPIGLPYIINRFKNRKIIKIKKEIEELKLEIEKVKLDKELNKIKEEK